MSEFREVIPHGKAQGTAHRYVRIGAQLASFVPPPNVDASRVTWETDDNGTVRLVFGPNGTYAVSNQALHVKSCAATAMKRALGLKEGRYPITKTEENMIYFEVAGVIESA